jgi:predicted enzyme related to lactoylglutathione lyase
MAVFTRQCRSFVGIEYCSIEAARVASAGGRVIRPKFSIGEFGWVSICQDTEGNLLGLSSMK